MYGEGTVISGMYRSGGYGMGTRKVVRLAVANNINEGNDTIITAHVFEGQSDPSLNASGSPSYRGSCSSIRSRSSK